MEEERIGRFGFLAKKMYDPDASPFDAIPDRLWFVLKLSLLFFLVLIFVLSAFYPHSQQQEANK